MGDFKTFRDYLVKGDMDGVTIRFCQDFLERPDRYQNRPIHYACYYGHVGVTKFLIEHKCDIESKDNKDWRPIHVACCYGHVDVVKLLVNNNCELQCRDIRGSTPLNLAQQKGHQACTDFMTEAVKLAQFFDRVRKNEYRILEGLKIADVVTREEQGTGLSFLEVVLKANATEVLKYLLDKRIEDEEIPQIKFYIDNCSRPAAVELIQEFFLYRSIRYHHADGFELSCLARIVNGHRNIVTTSFVEIAAEFGTSAFISEILKKTIYNKEEWARAKDLATLNGQNKILDAILDREILLTSRANGHFSIFHNAICDNDPDLMRYIFDNGLADADFNNEVVGTGLSLAHMLCHVKCIQTLQQFNVNVNTQNKYSQSPLHEAISSGMTDHCSYLISQACDIDKPGFMELSGLQCAVMEGLENLCDELVKNGADCMRYVEGLHQSYFKDTALPISTRENAVTLCIKKHQTVYPCFLEVLDSNKVNCTDGNENTLLHIAVIALLPDLCETLIKCGAKVESINASGNSPLLELFSHSDGNIVQDNLDQITAISNILIDSGADINDKSCTGVTVFGSASQCNSERLMLHVLSKRPDPRILTESDFKLAFTKAWFVYAKDLIDRIPKDSLKSIISTEIFHVAMPRSDPELLTALFINANCDIQQSIIEDLLANFVTNQNYEAFMKLLETKIIDPKLFPNGETLLTSLLKEKNLKYCWAIIRHAANKKCFYLANAYNQIPLQVAVESELYDLVCPLIFECDDLNNEHSHWNTILVQLFYKLSNNTDIIREQKLMTAVKAIICREGNIYEQTSGGTQIIEYCTKLPLRTKIESFQDIEKNRDSYLVGQRASKIICKLCLARQLNCVLDCGHTVCMVCGMNLFRCPMCNAEPTNPKRLFIN